jgi:hypothetical protein
VFPLPIDGVVDHVVHELSRLGLLRESGDDPVDDRREFGEHCEANAD